MIRHFVYLPLVHIIVIFNQAVVSFVSVKLASSGWSKEPCIADYFFGTIPVISAIYS